MTDRIALIAKAFGVNRAGLGALLGVQPSALSNWKHDGIPPARKWQLREMAQAREINIDDLLAERPEPDAEQEAAPERIAS